MELSRRQKAEVIRRAKERAAEMPANHTHETSGGKVTSLSGPLDDDAKEHMEGLSSAFNCAPKVEQFIANGQTKEAIDLFQEATGVDRDDAMLTIRRLECEFCHAQRVRRRWFALFLVTTVATVVWLLFR